MRIESRIILDGGSFRFQIVDVDDSIERGDEILAEELFLSEAYAREQTAERNGNKWVEKFRSASEALKRTMCGFDPVGTCSVKRPMFPVRRRVGS